MLPTLQIGPLALQTSGFVILISIWLGLSLSERNAARCGIKASDLYNLAMVIMLGGLIGARLSFVLRYPGAFAANPLSVVSINPGLLDPLGGLAAGTLAGLIYGERKQLSFWSTLDALTPALAVLSLGLGIAHLASGAAFGAPSDLPWAIELWGAGRHPAQVYETIVAALILGLIFPGRGLIRPDRPGVYFLSFIALSAGGRLFLEAFRGDSQLFSLGLRSAQIFAWLGLALSLTGIYSLRRNQ